MVLDRGGILVLMLLLSPVAACAPTQREPAAVVTPVPGAVRSTVGIVTSYDATDRRMTLEGGRTFLLPSPAADHQLPGGLTLPPRVGETVRITYVEQGNQKVIRFLEPETPQNNM